MSLNVMSKYLKARKRDLTKYASLSLDKYFNKKIFDSLLDTYTSVRYYNTFDDMSSKRAVTVINKHIEAKAKSLAGAENEEVVDKILYFFGFIYYLDDVLSDRSDKEVVDAINDYRVNKLNLPVMDKQEFLELINNSKSEIKKFFDGFQNNNFYLELKKTSINNCYDVIIKYKLTFPKLYSSYAIDKVFNNGIVGENKLFIEYYLVVIQIINEIRNLKYKNNYLVEFAVSLFEKSDKILRLFNIIDDDLMKDKVIMKINYQDFICNRDLIYGLISEGYKFALIIDDSFAYSYENKMLLSLFSYIIVKSEIIAKELEISKNVIKC